MEQQLPTTMIAGQMITRSMARNLALVASASQRVSNSDCPICLESLSTKEAENQVIQLPCGHQGHEDCLSSWISLKHICPTCRSFNSSIMGINTANGKILYFNKTAKNKKFRARKRSVATQSTTGSFSNAYEIQFNPSSSTTLETGNSTQLVQTVNSIHYEFPPVSQVCATSELTNSIRATTIVPHIIATIYFVLCFSFLFYASEIIL